VTVRADWNLGAVELPDLDDDPFADASPVEELGTPVDLSVSFDDARSLFWRRARMVENVETNCGISCSLMTQPGTDCRTCPVSRAVMLDSDHGALCRAGARAFEAAELVNALRGVAA
jgi:hypothetical protein